jgi:hypothetical protein
LVERFFNKIKQCRRIATRTTNSRLINYLAFLKLAAIRIWLRAYESTPWRATARRHELSAVLLNIHSRKFLSRSRNVVIVHSFSSAGKLTRGDGS